MRPTLTEEEISTLAHIMNHFTDYMAGDNRSDHGLGILKGYREVSDERRIKIYQLAGKLMRLRKKIQHKHYLEDYGRKEI
jgi:hypothetical protein